MKASRNGMASATLAQTTAVMVCSSHPPAAGLPDFRCMQPTRQGSHRRWQSFCAVSEPAGDSARYESRTVLRTSSVDDRGLEHLTLTLAPLRKSCPRPPVRDAEPM